MNILISRVFFAPAAMMGQRQASQPALLNGGPQPRVVTNGEDQGYYQNIGTAHLQQPMPLRYNNGGPGPVVGQQRFGSQSSLQQVLLEIYALKKYYKNSHLIFFREIMT